MNKDNMNEKEKDIKEKDLQPLSADNMHISLWVRLRFKFYNLLYHENRPWIIKKIQKLFRMNYLS